MSELISRLKEIIEKYNAGCYNETCNPFDSCTDCVLKQIREVIESQPSADSGTDICVGTNQWIPCSSGRLPKHKQQAFITVKLTESRRYVTTANYYTETGIVDECEWDGEGFYSYDSEYGYGRYENVIAWMPAEPYEGE